MKNKKAQKLAAAAAYREVQKRGLDLVLEQAQAAYDMSPNRKNGERLERALNARVCC